jgi:Zn ribbon nucleic-acid-binding protein
MSACNQEPKEKGDTMTNKNCLEGIRCPQCGHEDAFRIEAQITVYVTDDGTEDQGGDYAWEDESPCQCVACMHTATIKDFRIENQSAGEGATACGEDAFVERFRPIVNHINPNASFDFGYGGCIFETYGEEYEFVCAQNPRCIWTLIEADGGLYAESGMHIVNRLGYFISETPLEPVEHLSFCLAAAETEGGAA